MKRNLFSLMRLKLTVMDRIHIQHVHLLHFTIVQIDIVCGFHLWGLWICHYYEFQLHFVHEMININTRIFLRTCITFTPNILNYIRAVRLSLLHLVLGQIISTNHKMSPNHIEKSRNASVNHEATEKLFVQLWLLIQTLIITMLWLLLAMSFWLKTFNSVKLHCEHCRPQNWEILLKS